MPQRVGGEHQASDVGEMLLGVNPDGEYVALNTDDDGNLKAVIVTEAAAEDDGTWDTHEVVNGRRQQYVADHEVKALLIEIALILQDIREILRKG